MLERKFQYQNAIKEQFSTIAERKSRKWLFLERKFIEATTKKNFFFRKKGKSLWWEIKNESEEKEEVIKLNSFRRVTFYYHFMFVISISTSNSFTFDHLPLCLTVWYFYCEKDSLTFFLCLTSEGKFIRNFCILWFF